MTPPKTSKFTLLLTVKERKQLQSLADGQGRSCANQLRQMIRESISLSPSLDSHYRRPARRVARF